MPEPAGRRSADEIDRILEALQAVWPGTQRQDAVVLYLRYWRHLKQREVAERLGVSAPRVQRTEARALQRLRHPAVRAAVLELAPAGSYLRVVLFPHAEDERDPMV